jgi:hypothetical protein
MPEELAKDLVLALRYLLPGSTPSSGQHLSLTSETARVKNGRVVFSDPAAQAEYEAIVLSRF